MKQAKTLSAEDRFNLLKASVENSFDFKLMIALASGKYWRAATAPRQENLRSAFAHFSVATYADRFSGFSGEFFKTLSVVNGPRRTMLVRTQIIRPGNTPVLLTYVTRRRDEEWRIIDVLLDNGISELAIRRSEYRSILKKKGISGLINLLKKNTTKLLQP
jgi:phospholipid transport system substrate-binding protein